MEEDVENNEKRLILSDNTSDNVFKKLEEVLRRLTNHHSVQLKLVPDYDGAEPGTDSYWPTAKIYAENCEIELSADNEGSYSLSGIIKVGFRSQPFKLVTESYGEEGNIADHWSKELDTLFEELIDKAKEELRKTLVGDEQDFLAISR